MKEQYLNNVSVGDEVMDYFMVKNCSIRTGANGKQYYDVMLGDKTGEVSGKKWDVQESETAKLQEISEGDIVKIKGIVNEWQSAKQFRIQKICKTTEDDDINITDYIKAAPYDSERMYNFLLNTARAMTDRDYGDLCERILTENQEKLIYYPAASRNHHAMYGGLLYHTSTMLRTAMGICKVYSYLNKDLLYSGVILHDMEKINEIKSNEYGVSPGYSLEGQFLGHLVMGVKKLSKLAEEMNMPKEKELMLEQMIISHHYEPEFGSPRRPLFPEGEVLHYLDILDARLCDMSNALSSTEPGQFSEKIWTLENRRIYKPEMDR